MDPIKLTLRIRVARHSCFSHSDAMRSVEAKESGRRGLMGNACEPLARRVPSCPLRGRCGCACRVPSLGRSGDDLRRLPPGASPSWVGGRPGQVSWVRRSTNSGNRWKSGSLMPRNIPAPVAGAGGEGRRVRSPGGCESRVMRPTSTPGCAGGSAGGRRARAWRASWRK